MSQRKQLLDQDLNYIGVPVRVRNALRKERGVTTVRQLTEMHRCKLLRLHRVGEGLADDTERALASVGLKLSKYQRTPRKKGNSKAPTVGKVVSVTVDIDGELITCRF